KWIGRAIGSAFVEPESETIWIWTSRFFEAGFVDQAEILPAIVAAVLQLLARLRIDRVWVRRNTFQQIERAETGSADVVPETIVAASPDDPCVAAFHFFRSQRNGSVHVVKVIFIGSGETGRRTICLTCFIEHGAGLWSFVSEEAIGDEGNDGNNQEKNDDAENSDFASWHGGLLLFYICAFGAFCFLN